MLTHSSWQGKGLSLRDKSLLVPAPIALKFEVSQQCLTPDFDL